MAKKMIKLGNGRRPAVRASAATIYKEEGDLKDPKLNELREDFLWAVQQRENNVLGRQRQNYDARHCVWANQSDDGRKWNPRNGEDQVFPWPGASDARVPLVDMYINKDVKLLNVLTARMPIAVRPTESNDTGFANTATSFLRWMVYEQMSEWRTENRLLANYFIERGKGVMGVFWDKRTQLGYEEIHLEEVIRNIMTEAQQNPQMDQRLLDLPQAIQNPAFDEDSVALAKEIWPDVADRLLRRAVQDLRETGMAKFPRPYVLVNRPRVRAYAVHEDIFIGPETPDFEDGRGPHVREILTEARLRDRIKTHDWDERWVNRVIETQRGTITQADEFLTRKNRDRRLNSYMLENWQKMFEVIHSHRRLTDENGVPSIFYTCWSHGIPDDHAYHDLLNYEHGEMPFTLFEREKLSRRPEDSRGYGEIASTWQGQIKAGWDLRVDRASLSTLPPSYYPDGQQPAAWGPGVQVPTQRPEQYGFFEGPHGNSDDSREVEESVRTFADEYFGRSKNPEDAGENQIDKQDLGDTWMEGEHKVLSQTFGLCQQFMPEEFWFSVTKSQKARSIRATRGEIQGKFSIGVSMDVSNLDPAQTKDKMAALETMLNMDVNGRIDRDEALTVAAEILDPNLGERLLKPGEEASLAEVADEKSIFVQLMAGIPVDVKPGQAYQRRLQVMEDLFRNNQRAQQAYQSDPQAKDAFDQRVKQLQLQVDQRQNAVTGRGGPNFAPKTLTQGE